MRPIDSMDYPREAARLDDVHSDAEQLIMSKKLTPWFAGDIKPSRKGVYERDSLKTKFYLGVKSYSYWNGSQWCALSCTVNGAGRNKYCTSKCQSLPWRGLAEQPK